MYIFLSLYCLMKWFFPKDLGFILFFYIVVLSAFGLSSACYNVMLFVVLLQRFICMEVIQTGKQNESNQSNISNYDRQYVLKMVLYRFIMLLTYILFYHI